MVIALFSVVIHSTETLLGDESSIDLSGASVLNAGKLSPREENALRVLVEEIEERTRLRLPIVKERTKQSQAPLIIAGLRDHVMPLLTKEEKESLNGVSTNQAEGFSLRALKGESPTIVVAGNDERGVLFGVGKLLREMVLTRDHVSVASDLNITSAPLTPIRGHQLGYRPKTNSYDAWTVKMWDDYIRDLAIFGCNSIEIIPPRSDDDADSPHFPVPPMDMMVEMSSIIDKYGLDVWIWYPAMDPDYAKSETIEKAVAEWSDVFKRLPRVDAVFVPSGDPGHTRPRYLMNLLEKETEALRKYHPKATMWISVQSFTATWWDEMMEILTKEEPKWLAGIVYGPQIRMPLDQLRKVLPQRYPIRRYPDITHSLRCQYPVPDWDVAFAFTEGREVINPRPIDQSHIFHTLMDYSIGFITYSEGCNDDVNKFVWSGLGWNPETPVVEILRDYSDFLVSERWADSFAQGLMALEGNWRGPLLTNGSVTTTLRQFQEMEMAATPQEKLNWRFQQALYRAYYDAYLRERLIHETDLERRAMDFLRTARVKGSHSALAAAESELAKVESEPVAIDLRERISNLAEALFQSVRMQLSVPRYQAIEVGRGATFDTVDFPLNDRPWLTWKFDQIRKIEREVDRQKAIEEIVDWSDPGPGGFYDDLGNPTRQPHLVREMPYEKDPGFRYHPVLAFDDEPNRKLSWCTHADGLNDVPLKMHYDGLDPAATYKVRVVYTPDAMLAQVRLMTDDGTEIHPFRTKPVPMKPLEFDIPASTTKDGKLDLIWTASPERGGAGRGCQVAEVWLIKKK